MNSNLFSIIEKSISAPDRTFIRTPDGKTYSYKDMLNLSGQYANTLADLGVRAGDRVAAQIDKCPEALFLYLACLRLGAVYLPLNADYTAPEVAYFLQDAEPTVAVCRSKAKADFDDIAIKSGVAHIETLNGDGTGSLTDKAVRASETFATIDRAGGDLAAILYTSGTTGRSKGAMLTHDNLTSNARTLAEYWCFTADDVLLHPLPVFHTHGLFVATNTILLSGGSMLLLPKFDASEMLRLMPEATVMMGVPTHYLRLLAADNFTRDIARGMRLFISGSAPLSPETHKEFAERTGHAILERYGMTETNMNTSNPYQGDRRPGTVGFPLPGTEVRIADPETGKVLKDGEIGGIEVRGPNVFKGYWRMPEKTAAEFRQDGFFITGDLGQIDSEGYVSIVGREKDLIISGGLNVYPAEIEAALDAFPEITESAVIGLPHRDFGEAVTAVVATRPGTTIDEASIREEMAKSLASFKVPKKVIFLEALPRNTMGKIQKKKMRESYKDTYN